eukprot:TRINITY_DN4293_c1_g1_i1.p1 TRINITY_DN4293_c1_g1~~TRINITY_DN4293_c1_g1_i1.p1  ORF type:complete len:653 (+),score=100.75 TRINITY_DN4293_c1_g1_i1:124-2082(+)
MGNSTPSCSFNSIQNESDGMCSPTTQRALPSMRSKLMADLPASPHPVHARGSTSSSSSATRHSSRLSSARNTARNTTWDFNPIGQDSEALKQLASQLLVRSYSGSGGVKVDVLRRFVSAVAQGHGDNSFHNFAHAVDGLQAVCLQGTLMPWDTILAPQLRFAVAVASLAVNIGHPGFDNAFLVETQDDIAHCYNDISPLENMHCSRLFEILKEHDSNVMAHFSDGAFRSMRRCMVDAILHTDPTCQDTVVGRVRNLRGEGCSDAWLEPFKDRDTGYVSTPMVNQAICRAMLISSELLHQTRPLQIANAWAELLQSELCFQDQRAQELGLPVSPLRDPTHQQYRSNLQLHYTSCHVAPLLGAQLRIFPSLQPAAVQLADNIQCWAEEVNSYPVEDKVFDSKFSFGELAQQSLGLLDMSWPVPAGLLELDAPEAPEPEAWSGTGADPEAPEPEAPISPKSETNSPKRRPSEQDTSQSLRSASTTATSTNIDSSTQHRVLVREVRRWQEDISGGNSQDQLPRSRRELVLLYMLSDAVVGSKSGGGPMLCHFLDTDNATPEEALAAQEAVQAGQRAAGGEMSTAASSAAASNGSSSGFVESSLRARQLAAESITTTLVSQRFNQVLTKLLHGRDQSAVVKDNRRMSDVSTCSSSQL